LVSSRATVIGTHRELSLLAGGDHTRQRHLG
jgi:hypothetical protein